MAGGLPLRWSREDVTTSGILTPKKRQRLRVKHFFLHGVSNDYPIDYRHDCATFCCAFLRCRVVWAVKVSLHALSRYRERIETEDAGADDDIADKILRAYWNSRPVQLRSTRERISKLLKHGTQTEYHQAQDMVLVVADGIIVSVYYYNRDRWAAVK